jgi:membrane-bound serine protease (ClpP class)
MKKAVVLLLVIVFTILWARGTFGAETTAAPDATPDRQALMLDIKGPIGPATRDFVTRSLELAATQSAALVIIRMDTPGGLDASTRDIIKAILRSSVPVATYVTPSGARAASAGAYILYASHIAAMSPATNVGAATPVAIIGNPVSRGKDAPSDQPESKDSGDPMERKSVNDAVAYIRGLAELRGRNADWAELAVRDADSITSEQALELGVIDLVADNVDDLLQNINGMVVEVNDHEYEIKTEGVSVEQLEPDWRSELLGVITSPTMAYLLLLIGVYGLILEGYHPGAILPGVVGAICLLMALYAFQMLPVNYAGLALIVLGVILLIAEVMAPSFGVLGFGGILATVIGSIILIDSDVPGYSVSRVLIAAIATVGSLGLMAIIWFAVRARQRPVVSGREQLLGTTGTALESFEHEGEVFVHSERWTAVSETPVKQHQAVLVTGLDGLTLKVRPVIE